MEYLCKLLLKSQSPEVAKEALLIAICIGSRPLVELILTLFRDFPHEERSGWFEVVLVHRAYVRIHLIRAVRYVCSTTASKLKVRTIQRRKLVDWKDAAFDYASRPLSTTGRDRYPSIKLAQLWRLQHSSSLFVSVCCSRPPEPFLFSTPTGKKRSILI